MALPSQSALKLKYVSEVCLALIGKGGKRFSCLSLPVFYFEAVKHLHCLASYASSNMGASRGTMMKQVFKAIKGQAGAQAELSIIA